MSNKICLLIESLNGGGAERSAGLLSTILSNLGHKIFIITLYDNIAYSHTGELINLGKYKNGSRTVLNKFLRYKELKNQFELQDFDIVLDFRMKTFSLREFLFNKLVFRSKMINMIRHYNLPWYLPDPIILSKYLYKNYSGINAVSFKIQKQIEKVYGFSNVNTIYSPIDLDFISDKSKEELLVQDKFIIAVGRADPVKQFGKLIDTYSKSILPSKDIKLYILGNGPIKDSLIRKAGDLNLNDKIKFYPFQENPFKYIYRAEFLVLSSKNEGFPRVLIESLACETPVVSFDCDSGPSEIIKHEYNGLLVENQNFDALKNALNKMVSDDVFYNKCKANCKDGLNRFSIEHIGQEWKNYIEELLLN